MLRRFFLGSLGGGLASAALGGAMSGAVASEANPIVKSRQGELRGAVVGGINVFKGIPFAAAPAGANHLQPPRPPASWDGVRDALEFGPKPPQPAYPPEVATLVPPEFTGPGADCLTLNVWSAELGAAKQPVMVWIAGGMFEYHGTGASPWYDGSGFAADGVVLVTINYRVGAEGFLYLGDGIANLGLLDQIAALEWVRDNIAAFGGDPGKVTVFGESAGALSIGTLLAMPRARGLFRRAIVESGGAQHVTSAATAERIGRRLAEKLGVPATRQAMAAIAIDKIIVAQTELRAELVTHPDPQFWGEVMLTSLPWEPVLDGKAIPAVPLDLVRGGSAKDIDLLVGSNTEEWRLFLVPGGAIDRISPELLAGAIAAFGMPVQSTLAAYGRMHPGAGTGDLFAAIMTDWYWRIPALHLAEAHVASAPGATHMYEFAWRSPQFDGRLGASHALEIAFVFNVLDATTEPLLGTSPPQSLADAMHGAWVAFAKTGNPGWAKFDLDHRAAMHFDQNSRLVDDPLARERVLWQGVR